MNNGSVFLLLAFSVGVGVAHFKLLPTVENRLVQFLWAVLVVPLALGALLVYPIAGGIGWWSTVATLFVGWFIQSGLTKITGFFGFKRGGEQVQRGTEIISDAEAVKWLKRSGDLDSCFAKIGAVPVPEAVEPTHFLMAGAPGSGKSLAFLQLLDSARTRGHRALVADLGGEFVKHYYRPGKDLILNPFDRRTEHWSPFAEMRQAYDAARIAASLIPEGSGESKEWNGYARAILEGILERCWETGQATNQALVYYALGANTKELAELCAGTPAAVYFVEGNERQLGSIRGILASYMKPLTYLRPEADAQAFSIRSWIENEGDGWLFITFKKDQLDALQKMLAAQVDTAASAILSTDSQLDRRLWVSLDEFAQLGEIRQLEPLLAMGRKYGVCAILGMQGMSQPAMTYGRERAQAVLASLGTWTVFRQADAESAEYMSRFLGDEELRREVSSTSTNKDSTSSSTSEQIVRQRAVMPGELQQLPARRAIVNIAGPLPPATTTIQIPADKPQAQSIKAVEEAPDARAMLIKHPKGQQPALEAPVAPPQLQGPARFEV